MDTISAARRSENMRRIRSINTVPELAVRRLVFALGYRFRLRSALPGKPDIVFPQRRKVIFVHGCFWHQHPDSTCLDGRRPKSNRSYWALKLDGNRRRDAERLQQLRDLGWRALVVWACETERRPERLARRLRRFLGKNKLTPAS